MLPMECFMKIIFFDFREQGSPREYMKMRGRWCLVRLRASLQPLSSIAHMMGCHTKPNNGLTTNSKVIFVCTKKELRSENDRVSLNHVTLCFVWSVAKRPPINSVKLNARGNQHISTDLKCKISHNRLKN